MSIVPAAAQQQQPDNLRAASMPTSFHPDYGPLRPPRTSSRTVNSALGYQAQLPITAGTRTFDALTPQQPSDTEMFETPQGRQGRGRERSQEMMTRVLPSGEQQQILRVRSRSSTVRNDNLGANRAERQALRAEERLRQTEIHANVTVTNNEHHWYEEALRYRDEVRQEARQFQTYESEECRAALGHATSVTQSRANASHAQMKQKYQTQLDEVIAEREAEHQEEIERIKHLAETRYQTAVKQVQDNANSIVRETSKERDQAIAEKQRTTEEARNMVNQIWETESLIQARLHDVCLLYTSPSPRD